MFTSGASPHSVRQTLVFCTGQGYMDIPYGRGRFSVRDGVAGASRTGKSRFLYGTGLRGHSARQTPVFCTGRVAGPLYGTLWSLQYRKKPLFCTGRVAGASVRYTVGPPVPEEAVFCTGRASGHAARPARAENRRTRLSPRFHRQQVMASS